MKIDRPLITLGIGFLFIALLSMSFSQQRYPVPIPSLPSVNPTTSPFDRPGLVPGQEYRIQTQVEEVRLDTVILQKGRQVTDLTQEDFEIYQDGKKQKINSCVYISEGHAARPIGLSIKELSKAPLINAPIVGREKVQRVMAFIIDDIGMDLEDFKYTRKALERFVQNQMRPDDLVAIMRTTRGIGALQLFSSDKRQLLAMIDNLHLKTQPWLPLKTPPGSRPISQLMAIPYFIQAMQDFPGARKSLIVITTKTMIQKREFSNYITSEGAGFYNYLADQALRAGIVIHMMNIVNLNNDLPRFEGGTFDQMDAYHDRVNSLMDNPLPQMTGGLLLDYKKFFSDEDKSGDLGEYSKGYYLLTYTPPSSYNAKILFHSINVSVKRPKMEVHARSGYYDAPKNFNAPPKENSLKSAIFSPFIYNDLSVALTSGYIDVLPDGYLIRTWLHIDPAGLGFVEDQDGNTILSFDIVVMTSNVNDFAHNSGVWRCEVKVLKENVAWIKEHGLRFSSSLPIKEPGAYYVRAGIKDVKSGKMGSAYQFMEIPDVKNNKLALSSMFIITREEDAAALQSKIRPEATAKVEPDLKKDPRKSPALRIFQPGESFEHMSVIYNSNPKMNLEYQFVLLKDGEEIHKDEPTLINLSEVADSQRISLRKNLELGKDMAPGNYVLLLNVKESQDKKEPVVVTQTIDFEIKSATDPADLKAKNSGEENP